MLATETILFYSFGYMGLLFAIAYYGDKRADAGRSIISNPYIYALSLAVYCTAWTFYGSVGLATRSGPRFLTIYLGPTLMAALGWVVLRKIIRISKVHRITSIADFIGSRYGKSTTMGYVVTIIAVLGVVPYISLQLKAIAVGFLLLKSYPFHSMTAKFADFPMFQDTAFYVALILAVFAILFGTRHLEATERHEGLVAAIAFESIIKLVAFAAVGVFVTYGMYDGFGDIMHRAREIPELRRIFVSPPESGDSADWGIYIFLSMMAILCLPRQFQIAVVENVNEDHLNKAIWLFPLYLLAINIFVVPVAFGGVLHFSYGIVDADTFVLTLPLTRHQTALALFVFLGGMSAATGMVIVETVALSTMISNHLVMPILLRLPFPQFARRTDYSSLLIITRRAAIVLVLLLGYAYFRYIGEFYALVSIGLISFAAVAQFAPAILGGIFWKGGTRAGALCGLLAGFGIWLYTLVLPTLVHAGHLPYSFVADGPYGIGLLKPYQLFGLQGFDSISHAVFWSMLFNVATYVGVSLFGPVRPIEHTQAALFVDVYKYSGAPGESSFRRGTASVFEIKSLLRRFLGKKRTEEGLAQYAEQHQINWKKEMVADSGLVDYAEKMLAGAIGSASAHVMVSSVVKEEPLGIEEVMGILDETRQVIEYSHELEKATAELKAANERLKELDRLKDEFISTVTHELRTPLTSIRSLSEIIHDTPDIDREKLNTFSEIIIKESERLTRLISQVLDFHKFESGRMDWQFTWIDLRDIIDDALAATHQLIRENNIQVSRHLPAQLQTVPGDRDRLIQVMLNLISNAVKFCEPQNGKIEITLNETPDHVRINIKDNGIGISPENQKIIFEQFKQVKDIRRGRPVGTGLGLTISRRIIEFHKGKIWVKSEAGQGAVFSFTVPKGNSL